jgi:hypothetical protein
MSPRNRYRRKPFELGSASLIEAADRIIDNNDCGKDCKQFGVLSNPWNQQKHLASGDDSVLLHPRECRTMLRWKGFKSCSLLLL